MKARTQAEIDMVITVFKMRNNYYTLQQIGDKFGVTREYIRQILNGYYFRDIIEKYNLKVNNKVKLYSGKMFKPNMIKNIINDVENGYGYEELESKYKIDQDTLRTTIFYKSNTYSPIFKELGYDLNKIKEKVSRNSRLLGNDDIFKIYKLKKDGYSQKQIAKMFCIAQSTVSNVLRGELNYIKDLHLTPIKNECHLSESDIIKLFEMRNNGSSLKDIGKKFGYSEMQIANILNGKQKTYNEVIDRNKLKVV